MSIYASTFISLVGRGPRLAILVNELPFFVRSHSSLIPTEGPSVRALREAYPETSSLNRSVFEDELVVNPNANLPTYIPHNHNGLLQNVVSSKDFARARVLYNEVSRAGLVWQEHPVYLDALDHFVRSAPLDEKLDVFAKWFEIVPGNMRDTWPNPSNRRTERLTNLVRYLADLEQPPYQSMWSVCWLLARKGYGEILVYSLFRSIVNSARPTETNHFVEMIEWNTLQWLKETHCPSEQISALLSEWNGSLIRLFAAAGYLSVAVDLVRKTIVRKLHVSAFTFQHLESKLQKSSRSDLQAQLRKMRQESLIFETEGTAPSGPATVQPSQLLTLKLHCDEHRRTTNLLEHTANPRRPLRAQSTFGLPRPRREDSQSEKQPTKQITVAPKVLTPEETPLKPADLAKLLEHLDSTGQISRLQELRDVAFTSRAAAHLWVLAELIIHQDRNSPSGVVHVFRDYFRPLGVTATLLDAFCTFTVTNDQSDPSQSPLPHPLSLVPYKPLLPTVATLVDKFVPSSSTTAMVWSAMVKLSWNHPSYPLQNLYTELLTQIRKNKGSVTTTESVLAPAAYFGASHFTDFIRAFGAGFYHQFRGPEIIKDMQNLGITPSIYSWTTLATALARDSGFRGRGHPTSEAEKIIKALHASRNDIDSALPKPSPVTYGAIITAFMDAGHLYAARRVELMLLESGYRVGSNEWLDATLKKLGSQRFYKRVLSKRQLENKTVEWHRHYHRVRYPNEPQPHLTTRGYEPRRKVNNPARLTDRLRDLRAD